jgi:hypothetical protein
VSTAALCLILAGASALIALVLNHIYARLALVELTLNEGLPPGYEIVGHDAALQAVAISSADVASLLTSGVHVFASRNCHACQRLLDELDVVDLDVDGELHLHYVDRPRPLAKTVVEHQGATLHSHHDEIAQRTGADPLPYTIAVGPESLVSRAVSPTVAAVVETARNAGVKANARARA